MNLDLSQVTCFLPFNKSVTEDLAGNTQWTVLNNTNDITRIIDCDYRSNKFKTCFLNSPDKSHPIRSVSTDIWDFGNKNFTISCWFMLLNQDIVHSLFYSTETDYCGIGAIFYPNIQMK